MKRRTLSLAVVAVASVLFTSLASPARADDYIKLDSAELEQTVLRAQMPKSLGSWTQNFYSSGKGAKETRPTVCWNAKGDVNLPPARSFGLVAYAVTPDLMGTVTIYQYATKAKADAALAALRKAPCSDSPTVTTDEGVSVSASSGSDFTDSTTTGLTALLTYSQGDKDLVTQLDTTQRGLAIVQTEIFSAVSRSTGGASAKVADRLDSVNKVWHANVVRSYEAFGQGNSR
ncbi:MAG: hypothetical protein O2815_07445 [Actinomycetota bacterium]|nr:hypothetical protein [Actinomycetota bacterium]